MENLEKSVHGVIGQHMKKCSQAGVSRKYGLLAQLYGFYPNICLTTTEIIEREPGVVGLFPSPGADQGEDILAND